VVVVDGGRLGWFNKFVELLQRWGSIDSGVLRGVLDIELYVYHSNTFGFARNGPVFWICRNVGFDWRSCLTRFKKDYISKYYAERQV